MSDLSLIEKLRANLYADDIAELLQRMDAEPWTLQSDLEELEADLRLEESGELADTLPIHGAYDDPMPPACDIIPLWDEEPGDYNYADINGHLIRLHEGEAE